MEKIAFLKKIPKTFMIVFSILVLTKLLLILFVYVMIRNDLVVFWGLYPPQKTVLLALGYQWDSRHFLNIAENWYPMNGEGVLYAFAPLYPILVAIANLMFRNYILSGVIVSNVCYFFSIWAFYRVALLYTGEKEACWLTLSFGLFPTYFVYSTLAYSEAPYLLFAILSWYYFEKKQYCPSAIYLTLCITTRYVSGLLLLIYTLIGLSRKLKICTNETPLRQLIDWRLSWFALPVVVISGFFFYFYINTGDFFIAFSSHSYFNDSLLTPIHQFFEFIAESSYPRNMVEIPIERYMFTLPFLVLTFIVFKDDKDLGLYGLIMMIVAISMVGVSSKASPRVMLASWVSIFGFKNRLSTAMYVTLNIMFFCVSFWVMLKFQTIFFA